MVRLHWCQYKGWRQLTKPSNRHVRNPLFCVFRDKRKKFIAFLHKHNRFARINAHDSKSKMYRLQWRVLHGSNAEVVVSFLLSVMIHSIRDNVCRELMQYKYRQLTAYIIVLWSKTPTANKIFHSLEWLMQQIAPIFSSAQCETSFHTEGRYNVFWIKFFFTVLMETITLAPTPVNLPWSNTVPLAGS